jgi:hypothetical protein
MVDRGNIKPLQRLGIGAVVLETSPKEWNRVCLRKKRSMYRSVLTSLDSSLRDNVLTVDLESGLL